METDEEEQAAAPDFGRAAPKAERVSIKLHELGPRLRLELVKVQEGLCDGAVLYHSHVTKTGDEAEATADAVARRAALKEERRQQQAENVERKKAAAAQKKKRRRGAPTPGGDDDGDDDGGDDEFGDDESSTATTRAVTSRRRRARR